jgi:PAS domain S-box-containing protein
LQQPSLLTLKLALAFAGVLALTTGIISGWVVTLRRQVRQQTDLVKEKLRREAALEQRYRDLVEEANDVIWTVDRSGRLLSINRAGEKMLGFERQHLIGRMIVEFAAPDARPAFEKLLETSGDNGQIQELTIVANDSTHRIIEVVSRPLPPGSQQDGLLTIARDVTERHKAVEKMAKLQQELVDASHLAGMAEVATSVLHNVGNVLNSANVSCTLSIDTLKQSKLANLSKVTGLMDQQSGNLADFLAQDPKGRQIPGYLTSLAPVLVEEQNLMLKELRCLRDKIDHIKEIVAMQQSYAMVSGVTENLLVTQLVEDALKLNHNVLSTHRIRVERQFEKLPQANLEKHKILQILLNLIRNAAEAMQGLDCQSRLLTLRVFRIDQGRVAIQIIDTGIGIAPENMSRIFTFGFTTRIEGHGFGLHNGANMAREMGGSLSAHSGGSGHGATFTLELPLRC